MNTGDKFRAIRKSNGRVAGQGKGYPTGKTLTVRSIEDDVITCKERTDRHNPLSLRYQIFTKYFYTEAI